MNHISDIVNLLKCPKTGQALSLKNGVLITDSKLAYKIEEDIIDLCIDDNPINLKIADSYNQFSSEYDLRLKNPYVMEICLGVVDFEKMLRHFAEEIKCIPDGIILDAPVGTAGFSVEFYKAKPNSIFIALDYSIGMLRVARKKCVEEGITNVILVRGDIGNVPLNDETLDGCFSLNGFHAFSNPEEGAKEIFRTIKNGAPMIATTVCSGERYYADYVIKTSMIPKGCFSNSLPKNAYKSMLERIGFSNFVIEMFGAIMFAKCEKNVI